MENKKIEYELSQDGLDDMIEDFLIDHLKDCGYSTGSEEDYDKLSKEMQERKKAAMVIITDGLQSPSPLPADIVSQLRAKNPYRAKERNEAHTVWNECCNKFQSLLTSPSQPGSLEGEKEHDIVKTESELLSKCLNMLRYLYMNEYCGEHGPEVFELIRAK